MANFAIYNKSDLANHGGTEKVFSLLGNKLLQNGHSVRIVSLSPEDNFQEPVVDWLRGFKVSRYSIPKTRRPERVHWLLRILQKKSVIGASQAILEDF